MYHLIHIHVKKKLGVGKDAEVVDKFLQSDSIAPEIPRSKYLLTFNPGGDVWPLEIETRFLAGRGMGFCLFLKSYQ